MFNPRSLKDAAQYEYRISNKEFRRPKERIASLNLFILIKMIECLTSKFVIQHSIFDIISP